MVGVGIVVVLVGLIVWFYCLRKSRDGGMDNLDKSSLGAYGAGNYSAAATLPVVEKAHYDDEEHDDDDAELGEGHVMVQVSLDEEYYAGVGIKPSSSPRALGSVASAPPLLEEGEDDQDEAREAGVRMKPSSNSARGDDSAEQSSDLRALNHTMVGQGGASMTFDDNDNDDYNSHEDNAGQERGRGGATTLVGGHHNLQSEGRVDSVTAPSHGGGAYGNAYLVTMDSVMDEER